jgi:2-phospho-L-lactate guanylyltransferase
MRVLVPFAVERPKTRLAGVLTAAERRAFADAMLADVLAAVRGAGFSPELLTTEPLDPTEWTVGRDVPQTVDERPLTDAVNAVIEQRAPSHEEPLGIVMADLALATPAAVQRLVEGPSSADATATPADTESSADAKSPPADLVIAPGLGGGTNALVIREPDFRVDYHGASVRDHRQIAHEIGATVREVDSQRLATDVDEPRDLTEVLLHTDGRAREWLLDAGFEVDEGQGRIDVVRRK